MGDVEELDVRLEPLGIHGKTDIKPGACHDDQSRAQFLRCSGEG